MIYHCNESERFSFRNFVPNACQFIQDNFSIPSLLSSVAPSLFSICLTVHSASEMRVTPFCAHAADCAGCTLQHVAPTAQIMMKQSVMLDVLQNVAQVRSFLFAVDKFMVC